MKNQTFLITPSIWRVFLNFTSKSRTHLCKCVCCSSFVKSIHAGNHLWGLVNFLTTEYQSNPCCGCMITEDLKEIPWKMKDTVDCCSCIIGSLWFWITYAKYESQSVMKGHNGLKSFLKEHFTNEYLKFFFVSTHYWSIPKDVRGSKVQKKIVMNTLVCILIFGHMWADWATMKKKSILLIYPKFQFF